MNRPGQICAILPLLLLTLYHPFHFPPSFTAPAKLVAFTNSPFALASGTYAVLLSSYCSCRLLGYSSDRTSRAERKQLGYYMDFHVLTTADWGSSLRNTQTHCAVHRAASSISIRLPAEAPTVSDTELRRLEEWRWFRSGRCFCFEYYQRPFVEALQCPNK